MSVLPLLDRVRVAGDPPVVLGREPGFAIKLVVPPPTGSESPPQPPGQGQLLVALRGEALVTELGGHEGKVVQTTRPDLKTTLHPGMLLRVANDARWRLASRSPDTVILALSTSVPRADSRCQTLATSSTGRLKGGLSLLFSNERVRVEQLVAHRPLPLVERLRTGRTARSVEYLIGLTGTFDVLLKQHGSSAEHLELRPYELVRLPTNTGRRFVAKGRGAAVGLLISLRKLAADDQQLDRAVVRGFTPFEGT